MNAGMMLENTKARGGGRKGHGQHEPQLCRAAGGCARALQGKAYKGDEGKGGAVVCVQQMAHADAYFTIWQNREVLVLAGDVAGT
jgi:hypothetical protein